MLYSIATAALAFSGPAALPSSSRAAVVMQSEATRPGLQGYNVPTYSAFIGDNANSWTATKQWDYPAGTQNDAPTRNALQGYPTPTYSATIGDNVGSWTATKAWDYPAGTER